MSARRIPYEWDTAAGELILAEAGGRTRTLPDDGVLRYNEKRPAQPVVRLPVEVLRDIKRLGRRSRRQFGYGRTPGR